MASSKTFGILGGMGPEATAELYKKIIDIYQSKYGAKYDSDYPTIFIYNLPLPDIVQSLVYDENVSRMVENAVNKLKSIGCEFIAVPCNTVFCAISSLTFDVSLMNIVEETCAEASRRNVKKVGLLATRNTTKSKLYESFSSLEFLQLSDYEQEKVNEIILRILAGFKRIDDREYIRTLVRNFEKRGADAVILGCTELSLLISQFDCDVEILDSLQILSEAIVRMAVNVGESI